MAFYCFKQYILITELDHVTIGIYYLFANIFFFFA